MSLADAQKWNEKYARRSARPSDAEPDEELRAYSEFMPKQGLALDLACGTGKNSLYLARIGLDVIALDCSRIGLAILSKVACELGLESKIKTVQADLDETKFQTGIYDLIVVTRFLNRSLFKPLQASLKPGGIVLYKTFNQNILNTRPKFNAAFTIEVNALIAGFNELEILVDNRTSVESEYAFIIARK